MDPYLLEVCTPASDACNTLGNATETADWGAMYEAGKTMFRFSNAWTTDLVEAKTLAMFAYMLKARRVMEIGMFTGYGALSIAEVRPASPPLPLTPTRCDGLLHYRLNPHPYPRHSPLNLHP